MGPTRGNLEDFYARYYYVNIYLKAYGSVAFSLLETNLNPRHDDEVVQPPLI